ncbi:MAG: replication factor C large subunit [Minisyncoccales bacterium]
MHWTEKHRPKKFEEVIGQKEQVEKLQKIINEFADSKKRKPIVLHGAPGTGKTTLAYVIANETNSEIFELNASDLRNKGNLNEVLRPATEQKSLLKKGKIILIDEVDGISGVDRGGIKELISIMKSMNYLTIMTANDIWNKKFSDLRKKSELIQLKELHYSEIRDLLGEIIKKENIIMNQNILTSIAIRAKGDLRAAINDLHSVSRLPDPSIIVFDERNKESDIFNALKQVLQGQTNNRILSVFDSVNLDLDQIMLWLEENISKEYKGEELAKAYDFLSKADLFKGRIYKQQYWRFMVYQNIFLSYGISSAKKGVKTGFTSYKQPSRILKIWINNQRTAKKKSISQKYAEHVHIGYKRAMHEFPIVKEILKSNPVIQKELKLEEDEIAYLMK